MRTRILWIQAMPSDLTKARVGMLLGSKRSAAEKRLDDFYVELDGGLVYETDSKQLRLGQGLGLGAG